MRYWPVDRKARGASNTEYALILTFVASLALVAVDQFGSETAESFEQSASILEDPDAYIASGGSNGGSSGDDGNNGNGGGGSEPHPLLDEASYVLNPSGAEFGDQEIGAWRVGFSTTSSTKDPLLLPWSGEDYLFLSGSTNSVSTPVKTPTTTSATQAFDARFDIDFRNAGVSESRGILGGDFGVRIAANNQLEVFAQTASGSESYTTSAFPVTSHGRVHLRVTWNAGDVRISTKPTDTDLASTSGWNVLETIPKGAANLSVTNNHFFGGGAEAIELPLYRGLVSFNGDTLDMYPDRDAVSSDAADWTSDTGEVWTLNRVDQVGEFDLSVVDKPTVSFNGDSYLIQDFAAAGERVAGTDEITILVHRNRTNEWLQWKGLVSSEAPNGGTGFRIHSRRNTPGQSSSRIDWGDGSPAGGHGPSNFVAGQEHVIAIRSSADTFETWTNVDNSWIGAPIPADKVGSFLTNDNLTIGAGGRGSRDYDHVEIYNVAFFDEALTDGEVETLANSWLAEDESSSVEVPVSDCPAVMASGDLRFGIAAEDTRTDQGWVMWSQESVHARFSNPPHTNSAGHFVMVVYDGGEWKYDSNYADLPFTPEPTDCLVAEVDFDLDIVIPYVHEAGEIFGINAGYTSGPDIVPNVWNGTYNFGEFSVLAGDFANASAEAVAHTITAGTPQATGSSFPTVLVNQYVPERDAHRNVSQGANEVTVRGRAKSVGSTVQSVEYRINGGAWTPAGITSGSGTSNVSWEEVVTSGISPGVSYLFEFRMVSADGSISDVVSRVQEINDSPKLQNPRSFTGVDDFDTPVLVTLTDGTDPDAVPGAGGILDTPVELVNETTGEYWNFTQQQWVSGLSRLVTFDPLTYSFTGGSTPTQQDFTIIDEPLLGLPSQAEMTSGHNYRLRIWVRDFDLRFGTSWTENFTAS